MMSMEYELCAWCCALMYDAPHGGLYVESDGPYVEKRVGRRKIHDSGEIYNAVKLGNTITAYGGYTVGGTAVTQVAGTKVCARHANFLIKREKDKSTR